MLFCFREFLKDFPESENKAYDREAFLLVSLFFLLLMNNRNNLVVRKNKDRGIQNQACYH